MWLCVSVAPLAVKGEACCAALVKDAARASKQLSQHFNRFSLRAKGAVPLGRALGRGLACNDDVSGNGLEAGLSIPSPAQNVKAPLLERAEVST